MTKRANHTTKSDLGVAEIILSNKIINNRGISIGTITICPLECVVTIGKCLLREVPL